MTSPPAGKAPLSLLHRTRFPAAGDGPHPTVIALHGRGSDESDLIGLAPYLNEQLLWVSPRAPLTLDGGYEWYRLQAVGVPDPATFEAARVALSRFLDEVRATYPVDPRRVYLFGFSQGGMMAYTQALTRPAGLAGVIAHSSYIPLAAIEAAATIDAAGLRGKPFAVLHGLHDPLIPVAWARDTLTRFGADVA
jgi:phospholipase/carboxylesterase